LPDLIIVTAILIMAVTIFIMIHGFGLIGSGTSARSAPKGPRITIILMGVLAIGLSSALLVCTELAVEMMILFMSVSLLFNGIASMISGITGNNLQRELK
jgi:uncharacterized membrane protein HdeD (DUF308 family)